MGDLAAQAGRKVLAVGVLVVAAFILFKIVLNLVLGVAMIIVVVLAILGVIWALRVL